MQFKGVSMASYFVGRAFPISDFSKKLSLLNKDGNTAD